MDKKAMLKQAAQVLREQQAEIKELHEKNARAEKAEAIVRSLIENDELLAEDVLHKLSELRIKSLQDLDIMEKAAELFHSNVTASFGTLSDQPEFSSNPLLNFLFNDTF
jgi:hypothetical protein